MTHPYLTEWRESQLANWRNTNLNPDYTEPTHDHHPTAPGPAPVLQRPDPARRAAPQHARLGARRARPRPSLGRAGTVMLGSMRALFVCIALCAAALLLSACSGPSDLEAERATAAALQDAIAQAQAERPDLWTTETIERANH